MGINEILRIGENVKKLRIEKGISLTDMAKILGISKTAYANYEADRRNMPNDIIAMVSLVLKEPMEWVLGMQYADPCINPFEYLNEAQQERMLMYCYGATQEEAKEHIKNGKNKKHIWKGNHFSRDRSHELSFVLNEDELLLYNHYSKLNTVGKDEAVKRVEELTHIEKYTKDEEK